jgi:hypothetical protein
VAFADLIERAAERVMVGGMARLKQVVAQVRLGAVGIILGNNDHRFAIVPAQELGDAVDRRVDNVR